MLRFSLPCGPASLNRQIMLLLAGLGVPTDTFIELANSAVITLTRAFHSQEACLLACEYLKRGVVEDRIRSWVHAGLWNDAYIIQQLSSLIDGMLSSILTGSHIPLRFSARPLIVSDPTGLLQVCVCVRVFE